LFHLNLIEAIFGGGLIGRLLFIIVGVAAGYLIYSFWVKPRMTPPVV
jgi:uncharacterized membrane protein YuzA (DUF378 family)